MCHNLEEYLDDLISQDWRKRQYAAEKLDVFASPMALVPLIKALEDKEPSVRWRTAEALGKIRDRRAVPYLVPLLKDKEGEIRLSAVKALGEIRDIRAVFPLIDLLYDDYIIFQDITVTQGDYRDNSVKGSVIFALQKIGDTGALPALKKMLNNETHPMIKVLLDEAVSYIEQSIEMEIFSVKHDDISPSNEDIPLENIEKDDETPGYEEENIEEIFGSHDNTPDDEGDHPVIVEEVSDVIQDDLHDIEYEENKYNTTRLSGELLEEELKKQELENVIKEQISKFESTCMFTRMDGVQTLEKIGKPAVELLVKALEDQNWRIREGAAEALSSIGDISVLSAFKKALPIEPEDSIKNCLEQAIAKIEIELEVKTCIEKLSDNNMFTQLDAIQTLEKIGKPAIPYLIDTLKDSNWKVREGSLEVLSTIGDDSILGALKEAYVTEKDDYLKKNIQKIIDKFSSGEE
ncbi:MAG: HEAT repeat domain-containing protein [Candidatus Eremiobacterota bacterium]